jgi:hypothetical protein
MDRKNIVCEFCTKIFSTTNILVQHQKKAKYCLELQGTDNLIFECSYCKKCLSTNERLTTHTISCKEKKIQESKEKDQKIQEDLNNQKKYYQEKLDQKDIYYIEKLGEKNEYIAKLEAKLEKFENAVTSIAEAKASKATPTTTNNTNITVTNNNTLNLSQEHVKKVLTDHLNYNVVYAGQAGFATFVVDNMLKDETGRLMYRCVDPSRQMFEFIDENGETVRDMRAEKLIQSLLKGDAIKLGLEAAAVGWNTEDRSLNNERTSVFGPKVNEYAELNRNNTVFRTKVSSLTT